jgi:hypothetical protein
MRRMRSRIDAADRLDAGALEAAGTIAAGFCGRAAATTAEQ